MGQTLFGHVGGRAEQRLHSELDTPALPLVFLVGSTARCSRAPVDPHVLPEDEELVSLERGQASSKLEVCAEVVVQELRVVVAPDRQLAAMAGDGRTWVNLNQVSDGARHADDLSLLVIERVWM